MEKSYTDNPTITDTVIFDLVTRDADGFLVDAYRVDNITIYFLERSFWNKNFQEFSQTIQGQTVVSYFNAAVPVAIIGTDDFPAYLSTDTDNALITLEDTGTFQLAWTPTLAKEGDYFLCYTWTPILAADRINARIDFMLAGDTQSTTSLPTHFTKPEKYETLLERYLPSMFKTWLGNDDLSPEVLDKLNKIIAAGFTGLENLANQIIDLLDANATHETILPYLAKMLGVPLRTQDITLWRRQTKQAVPLYKRKGTLGGLVDALDQSQARFVSLTRYWQCMSQYTWQQAFIITEDGTDEFTLEKPAILPVDADNFAVFFKADGESSFETLDDSDVTYDDETTVTWNGADLEVGDVVLLRYLIQEVPTVDAQTLETYLQSLPLADTRDELTVTYPLKNWNVRLIEDSDVLLPDLCPSLHPFYEPVIYGRVRTEFPYSENIYNMEEYNGSTRDSTDPCDLDKDFLDECSCCMSSSFTVDVEIDNLSEDRIEEVEAVVNDFVPFHAKLYSINYTGAINEYMPPPMEEIEILIRVDIEENLIFGQSSFNRIATDGRDDTNALKRNMLATASTAATASTGVGTNSAIVLYSPGVRFDRMGLTSNNLLEILSGTDAGEYQVTLSGKNTVDIDPASPDSITFPLDSSEFPYRLSNLLFSDSVSSIYQDDLYTFSDANVDFIESGTSSVELGATWSIVVTSGIHSGTYPIEKVNSDGTLVISGWGSISSASSLSYNLLNNVTVVESSTTGALTVTRRGRIETDDIQEPYKVIQGDYVLIGSTQYEIISFVDGETFYIHSYTAGDVVGTLSIDVYHRLVSSVGYVDLRGMVLTTVTDYESSLGIQNGSNPVATPLENDLFMENFLVLIGSSYYQIAEWDGNDITIVGPMLSWGLSGTSSISFSLVKFTKTHPIITEDDVSFDRLDRRNDGVIIVDVETSSMPARAATLNAYGKGSGLQESMSCEENIWIEVKENE